MKREDWNINSSCVCNVIKMSRPNPNYEQTSNGYSCFHFLRITKETRNLFFYSRWNLLGCNITPGKINTYRPGAKKMCIIVLNVLLLIHALLTAFVTCCSLPLKIIASWEKSIIGAVWSHKNLLVFACKV